MEWVETTGRTLEQAIEAALDQLGVDADDLEYEVVTEPKTGLFGRFGGSDARIRARVKPISREKPNDKRRRRSSGGKNGRSDGPRSGGRKKSETSEKSSVATKSDSIENVQKPKESTDSTASSRSRRRRGGRSNTATRGEGTEATMESEQTASVEDQVEAAERFLDGLLDAFDLDAEVVVEHDDEQVTAKIEGGELGVLVGGKGATLDALGELTRTVVQRNAGGGGARIVVDVAGYRERRREALADFARKLAQTAIDTGRPQVLEPMNSSDRKVVHDTVAELDGVATESEGESERRRVVIRPA